MDIINLSSKGPVLCRRRALALFIGFSALPGCSIAEQTIKGKKTMTAIPNDGEFFFTRAVINLKAGKNSVVPEIDPTTIAPYAAMMSYDTFYVGRTQAGRLVYQEKWTRRGVDPSKDTIIDDGTSILQVELPSPPRDDPDAQVPALFMRTASGAWSRVESNSTMGESEFLRIKWLKSLTEDTYDRDAEILTQTLSSKTEYTYASTGEVVSIYDYDRSTGFKKVRRPI